jgi:hypothetical protein
VAPDDFEAPLRDELFLALPDLDFEEPDLEDELLFFVAVLGIMYFILGEFI